MQCAQEVGDDDRNKNQYLAAAQRALCVGETRKGRRMARQVLAASVEDGDGAMQASAALVLSQAYVLESRFKLAHETSARAHQLFLRQCDGASVDEALAIHRYSASALGFDVHHAGQESAADAFQPSLHTCFAEALQVLERERLHSQPADLTELERLLAQARENAPDGEATASQRATLDIGALLLDFASCFVACRRGRAKEADAFYLACLERATGFAPTSWVQAVLWWARVERAVCHGDIEASTSSLHAMGEVARAVGHAQLQAVAMTLENTLRPPLNQWNSNYGDL